MENDKEGKAMIAAGAGLLAWLVAMHAHIGRGVYNESSCDSIAATFKDKTLQELNKIEKLNGKK